MHSTRLHEQNIHRNSVAHPTRRRRTARTSEAPPSLAWSGFGRPFRVTLDRHGRTIAASARRTEAATLVSVS
jgi:hypothetical protein